MNPTARRLFPPARPTGARPARPIRTATPRLLALPLGLLLAALSGPLAAQPVESLERLRQVATDFLLQQFSDRPDTEVRIEHIDPRLRLAECPAPPEAFLPHGRTSGNALTVGVRCTGGAPWTVYLPASVIQFADVVVTTRALARGATIQADAVRIERREISATTQAWFEAIEAVEGLETTRPIQPGTVLAENQLKAADLVRRREPVTLLSGSNTFQVRVRGTALQNGALGDRIRVRNESSRRELEGVITGPGEVRIM